jgi:hypothetical protein
MRAIWTTSSFQIEADIVIQMNFQMEADMIQTKQQVKAAF